MWGALMKSRKEEIINLAIEYIETRGVHAFSYNDISKQLNITKASIHYHFPSKNDLILAVIEAYKVQLNRVVDHVSTVSDLKKRIFLFFQHHFDMLQSDNICAVYSLEMNIATLDSDIQVGVQSFLQREKDAVKSLLSGTEKEKEFEAMRLLSLFKGALVHRRVDKHVDVLAMVQSLM